MQMLPLTLMGLPGTEAPQTEAPTAAEGFGTILIAAGQDQSREILSLTALGGANQEAGDLEPNAQPTELDLIRDSEDEITAMWSGFALPMAPAAPLAVSDSLAVSFNDPKSSDESKSVRTALESAAPVIEDPIGPMSLSLVESELRTAGPQEPQGLELGAASTSAQPLADAEAPASEADNSGAAAAPEGLLRKKPASSKPVTHESSLDAASAPALEPEPNSPTTLTSPTAKEAAQPFASASQPISYRSPLGSPTQLEVTVAPRAGGQVSKSVEAAAGRVAYAVPAAAPAAAPATESSPRPVSTATHRLEPGIAILAAKAASEVQAAFTPMTTSQAGSESASPAVQAEAVIQSTPHQARTISFLPATGASLVKKLLDKLSALIQAAPAAPEAAAPETAPTQAPESGQASPTGTPSIAPSRVSDQAAHSSVSGSKAPVATQPSVPVSNENQAQDLPGIHKASDIQVSQPQTAEAAPVQEEKGAGQSPKLELGVQPSPDSKGANVKTLDRPAAASDVPTEPGRMETSAKAPQPQTVPQPISSSEHALEAPVTQSGQKQTQEAGSWKLAAGEAAPKAPQGEGMIQSNSMALESGEARFKVTASDERAGGEQAEPETSHLQPETEIKTDSKQHNTDGRGMEQMRASSAAASGLDTAPAKNSLGHDEPVKAAYEALRDLIAARRPGSTTIRLRPDDLGEITITVSVKGSEVRAEVSATSEGVRQTLSAHRGDLVSSLEQKGHTLSSFQVTSDRAEANLGQQAGHSRSQNQSLQQEDFNRLARLGALQQPTATRPRYIAPSTGVNVLA
jgi:hypothetical protein